MSALGHKQTFAVQNVMSALRQKGTLIGSLDKTRMCGRTREP